MVGLHGLNRHDEDGLSSRINLLSLDLNPSLGGSPRPEDVPDESPGVGGVVAEVGPGIGSNLESGHGTAHRDIHLGVGVELRVDVVRLVVVGKDDAKVVCDEAAERLIEGVILHRLRRPVDAAIGEEDLDVELGAYVKVSAIPSSGVSQHPLHALSAPPDL